MSLLMHVVCYHPAMIANLLESFRLIPKILLIFWTKKRVFMVSPCISNIKHFIVQLMHTNYKILRLLKYLKL